ncbi:DUF5979 domain-containing protein [Microbacterium fluvii]|uniref:DUF5979 domain-containing protein n=1 Tax=Microbacterium fluvii TaxID=415215 RepID=A0ABW2HDK0_9MICO|nr:DUF5979 domain-containing protein [Microbacterium fluvii]MCU4672830.1 DUF5979 domain-containing protein [Microbacterium fluvii]
MRTDAAQYPRRRRLAAATLAVALAASGAVALTPASPAAAAYPDSLNPFAMNGGFTVYAREDLVMANDETEGSLAAGGVARTSQAESDQYTIIHVSAGTADYTLPTVDGDPTRLLVGSYSPASNGILAITSAGTSDPTLQGDLKMVERTGPWQAAARADWLRLNLDASTVDATPLIDATAQDYPANAAPPASATGDGSIYTFDTSATAVADYVEANAEATYDQAKQCLDDLAFTDVGHHVGVAEDVGSRVVLEPLSADQPNVVDYEDIAGTALIQFSPGPTPGVVNPLVIRVTDPTTTTVIGARADPQGAYSPYIFWDLSELTGDVAVAAAEARIDGSIYAPDADVTITAAPLDGQVLGRDVTLQGGEVHSFLFAGTLTCEPTLGTFSMRKALVGIDDDELPDGTTFTVNYTATEPDGTVYSSSLELPAGGTTVDAGVDFPIGTEVTFAEIEPISVPGYTWTDVEITPSPITIGDEPQLVTVTNTAEADPTGTFSVAKEVEGVAPGDLPSGDVTVAWAAAFEGGFVGTGTLDVPLDGTPVDVGDQFPVGTRILLVEDRTTLPDVPGYDLTGVSWSPSRIVEITSGGQNVLATVTNTYAPEGVGRTITIVKSIGDASMAAFDYTLSYGAAPSALTTVPLPIDAPAELTGVDPAADVLYLAEEVPTNGGTPVDVSGWAEPVITVTTGTGSTDYPAPFGEPVEVDLPTDEGAITIEVANSLRQGTFTLQKEFEGISGENLPSSIEFTVAWEATLPDGSTVDGVLRLPADGTPVGPVDAAGDPLQFPYGTVVTYEELTAPNVPFLRWGAPGYSSSSLVIGTGGEGTVDGTVTNDASLITGTFLVSKDLVGISADELLDDTFTVTYTAWSPSSGVTTGTFELPADGTAAGPLDGDGMPVRFTVGTVVRLEEVTPAESALPDDYNWGEIVWTPSNFLVIRAGETAEATVTNSVEQLTRYSIVKRVDGPRADAVPAGTTYPVDWWLDSEPQTHLELEPDIVLTSDWIPVSSIVEVEEGDLPDVDGVSWGAPTWTVDGQVLTPEPDGRVVIPNAAINDQSLVRITLVNTADTAPTPDDPDTAPDDLAGTGGGGVSPLLPLAALGLIVAGIAVTAQRMRRAGRLQG